MPHSPPAYAIPLTVAQLADVGSLMLLNEQVRMMVHTSLKALYRLSFDEWITWDKLPTTTLLERLEKAAAPFGDLTQLAAQVRTEFSNAETVRHHIAHGLFIADDAGHYAFFNWRRRPHLTVEALSPALESLVAATWSAKAILSRIAEMILDGVLAEGSKAELGPWTGARGQNVKL